MSDGPRLRAALDGVATYVPGRPAADRPTGGAPAYKVSSNENPFPPLPPVLAVLAREAHQVNRYPDLTASALVAALADHLGVPAEQVATGTGSVGVLQQIVQASAGPGDEVLFAWRSFEAYPIVVQIAGARPVAVPLTTGERHDLDAMAAAVTARTRLALVCTPNNPTGTAVHREELDRFLDRVPDDLLVVIDEAYTEFVRDPDVPDALAVASERPNVVVLRTFSKAYGLAGLRVGYAVAAPRVAEALRKTAVPFGVSGLAQAAAVASLAATDELLDRVDALVGERERVQAELRAQGYPIASSEANFVWLRTGSRTGELAAAFERAGVVARPFGTEGVRITVAEKEANDLVLEVTAGWERRPVHHPEP